MCGSGVGGEYDFVCSYLALTPVWQHHSNPSIVTSLHLAGRFMWGGRIYLRGLQSQHSNMLGLLVQTESCMISSFLLLPVAASCAGFVVSLTYAFLNSYGWIDAVALLLPLLAADIYMSCLGSGIVRIHALWSHPATPILLMDCQN